MRLFGRSRRPLRVVRASAVNVLLALAVFSGCESVPEKEKPGKKGLPDDPEATAHVESGLAVFALVESSQEPGKTLEQALAELDLARARVPSPENRFRCARVAHLLLLQDGKKGDEDREKIAKDLDEEDAPSLALLSVLEATMSSPDFKRASEHGEKACQVAALDSRRGVRCFVGDDVGAAATVIWRRDPVEAAALMQAAAKLGSPSALVNIAKLDWEGRGRKVDRESALRLARRAAETSFTVEERRDGLLVGEDQASRFAWRLLGNWLVQEARFEDAAPALENGLAVAEDGTLANGKPRPDFVGALAQAGEIEAMGLSGQGDRARGKKRLQQAAELGHAPSLVVLGRLAAKSSPDEAKKRFEDAANAGSEEALACLGKWDDLAALMADRASRKDDNPELALYALRTRFLALAVTKGAAAREEVEDAARKASEPAPKSRPSARALRHIAGELSAADLQATMPASALLPRWRGEVELALAIRCLLTGDKKTAREHLEACILARAITNPEGELAWAALRAIP